MPDPIACPACGGPLYPQVGVIEYAALSPYGLHTVRRTRLGAFWACEACEYCAEKTAGGPIARAAGGPIARAAVAVR